MAVWITHTHQGKGSARMANHDWMSNVLDDLTSYCEQNGLDETSALVAVAKRIFESELRAMSPTKMTLENHLSHVNRRPI